MKVFCDVDYTEIENEAGRNVQGVVVTCSRCDHTTQSSGQSDSSVRRCMVLLKEECPNGERNFYEEGNVKNSNQSWTPPAATTTNSDPRQTCAALFGGAPASQGAPRTRKFSKPGARVQATTSKPSTPRPVVTLGQVPKLIAENDFCVIKCATTGLSTTNDEVCQVGLVQIDKGHARWRVSVNVKPTVPVGDRAAEIHGLDATRLHLAPSFAEIAQELIAFVGPRVLLGYNIAKFDLPILVRQFQTQAGLQVDDIDHLDVLLFERKYAQETFGTDVRQRHGLEDATERWDVGVPVTHDALNDAKAVWGVFVALCDRFSELGESTLGGALEILKAEGTLTAMGLRTAEKYTHLRR